MDYSFLDEAAASDDLTYTIFYCSYLGHAEAEKELRESLHLNLKDCPILDPSKPGFYDLHTIIQNRSLFLKFQQDATEAVQQKRLSTFRTFFGIRAASDKERYSTLMYKQGTASYVKNFLEKLSHPAVSEGVLYSIEIADYDDFNYAQYANFVLKNGNVFLYTLWEKLYAKEDNPDFADEVPQVIAFNSIGKFQDIAKIKLKEFTEVESLGIKELYIF